MRLSAGAFTHPSGSRYPPGLGRRWNNATLRLTDFLLNAGKQGSLDQTLTKNCLRLLTRTIEQPYCNCFSLDCGRKSLFRFAESGSADELLTNMVNASNVPSTPATRAILQMESNGPSAAQPPEVSDRNSWFATHSLYAWSCQASRD